MPLESMRMAGRRARLLGMGMGMGMGMGILAAILILYQTPGPSPSFRQGPPESRHRDVNLNRPTGSGVHHADDGRMGG